MGDVADARLAPVPHDPSMTYVLITTSTAGTYESYEQVLAALPTTRPEGLIARYAGMSDRGLSITAVWESKEHADRFTAELLVPTIRSVVGAAADEGESLVVQYDARDVEVVGTPV
jgi:hypothetical protein